MLTRLSIVTCPACGHEGRPNVKGEGAGILQAIPVVGNVFAAKDFALATLHCEKCSHPFTESLWDKRSDAIEKAKDTAASIAAKAREAVASATGRACIKCGAALVAGQRFCAKCGTPVGAVAAIDSRSAPTES